MLVVLKLVFLFYLCGFSSCENPKSSSVQISQNETTHQDEQQEKKLSELILAILEHYKQKDPVGLPGAPIPDPLPIKPMEHAFSVGRMSFKNMNLFGLKKFKIQHVNADIAKMKVNTALFIDQMDILGNYTLITWFSNSAGPFTVKLVNVSITAIVSLEVQKNGSLEAADIAMDLTFKDMVLNFENLGFLASMFQGMMNSVGTFLFDTIKPLIFMEANVQIRTEINKHVSKIPQQFPTSISPLDQLISEIRKKVRTMGYDPYQLADYNSTVGVFDIFLTHTWLYGVCSFHRTKDIVLEMRNNTLHALLEVGTQKVLGTTHWEILVISGFLSRVGTASFSVEYIRVQVNASQNMDTRNKPQLDDIQLELGNIQMRFDGLGTMDYIIEFAVNVLPNILRYQIMDAIEKPIKFKIQEELNKINVEETIRDNVKKLDTPEGLAELSNMLK